MLNYLRSKGYSEEEIQTILEEVEYYSDMNSEANIPWYDRSSFEGEFEDVPF